MTGLGKPNCVAKLKSLASAIAEILKGIPKFWGASLAQGHADFILWHAKFEVTSASRCRNIYGELPNFGELA